MKVEIKHLRSGKTLCVLDVSSNSTIGDLKKAYATKFPKYYPDRQQFKQSQERGVKTLTDETTLKDGSTVYFKDLGPQIGWTKVFLCEYTGPLITYLLFYLFPNVFYTNVPDTRPTVVTIAAACWTFHYAKRIFETIFVHRFSHGTMPIANLFKNCSYYWGFAAFISYFVNHPLYTTARFGSIQIYTGLFLFIVCELGNYSIHAALRNLRPPGSKQRKIPVKTGNPFCFLFDFVSCPNYTYEIGIWLGFTIMTQTMSSFLFTLAGFYQMTVWAQGKHHRYHKEFPTYPKKRTAIIPYLI